MMKGKFPNITQAQVLSALSWIAVQAVAAGWVNSDQSKHWLQLGSTIVSTAWILGDAALRGFRNIRAAAEAHAEAAKHAAAR